MNWVSFMLIPVSPPGFWSHLNPPVPPVTVTLSPLLYQDQRRPREVLAGPPDRPQSGPPVPVHPASLGVHTPDGAAAAPQEDPGVPDLQEHPRPPQDLL